MKLILSSYLLQHHSGYFVSHNDAKLKLALLCTSYLTHPCFSPCLDQTEIEVSVRKGCYAFQEYAAINWIHHIKCLTECGEVVTNVDSPYLKSPLITLLRRHLEQFDPDNSGSRIQDPELNRHSISAALDNCQNLYDMVDTICVNQAGSGMVMALIAHDCS